MKEKLYEISKDDIEELNQYLLETGLSIHVTFLAIMHNYRIFESVHNDIQSIIEALGDGLDPICYRFIDFFKSMYK